MEENWSNFEFSRFSKDKILFPYQQNAVKNAIKVLWKYYQNLTDFTKDEHLNINDARKLKIIQAYEENDLDTDIDFDFQKIPGLSREVKEKLCRIRPTSLAQASRISGVTPAAISLLMIWLKREERGRNAR